jgi:glycerophosphoryl diester phosphodiesterase
MEDPLFSAETIEDGLRIGASMELDLRVRKDGGFVVLHDADLGGETSGHGEIIDLDASDLKCVTMADGQRPVLTSEAMASILRGGHPDALLQFDMKDNLTEIGERGIDHLARVFADTAPTSFIISGACLDLIVVARDKLPKWRRGIDPTDKLVDLFRQSGLTAVERDLLSDLRGPTDPDTVYLAWQLLLSAHKGGLDLIGLCHAEARRVDAWTYNLASPYAGFSDRELQDFSSLILLRPDQITTDEALATEAAWRQCQDQPIRDGLERVGVSSKAERRRGASQASFI